MSSSSMFSRFSASPHANSSFIRRASTTVTMQSIVGTEAPG